MAKPPMSKASPWLVWLFACFAMFRAATGEAAAESLIERGDYLVNTIMACGNCHTPKDATGKAISELALSRIGWPSAAPQTFPRPIASRELHRCSQQFAKRRSVRVD
jgi:hypothetical protein